MKMESHGIPSRVHVSKAVVDRLALGDDLYRKESRGAAAGVPGEEETFLIVGKNRVRQQI